MNKLMWIGTLWYYDEQGKPKTNIPVGYLDCGTRQFATNPNKKPLKGDALIAHLSAIDVIRTPAFKAQRAAAELLAKAAKALLTKAA